MAYTSNGTFFINGRIRAPQQKHKLCTMTQVNNETKKLHLNLKPFTFLRSIFTMAKTINPALTEYEN